MLIKRFAYKRFHQVFKTYTHTFIYVSKKDFASMDYPHTNIVSNQQTGIHTTMVVISTVVPLPLLVAAFCRSRDQFTYNCLHLRFLHIHSGYFRSSQQLLCFWSFVDLFSELSILYCNTFTSLAVFANEYIEIYLRITKVLTIT